MQNETSYKLSIDWLNVTMSPREKYKMDADGQPIFTSKGKKMIFFMMLTGQREQKIS